MAEPNLAGFTLEQLGAWLGVEMSGRHSALGDAVTTARIFTALVPKLRARGIRTLGEAVQACRALTEVLDQHHRAGWVETVDAPIRADTERALGRIDSYPYRHRVRDVMRAPAKFISHEATVGEALARLMEERISSLYVRPPNADTDNPPAADTGIITERDLLRAISRHGGATLALPVGQFMSKPLAAVPADAFVYRAIGRMSRLNVRHLGAVDETGRVVGALSARDLLRLRAGEALSLGDGIDAAGDVHTLAAAWAKLPRVASSLIAEQVPARDAAAVISRELGAATRQAAVIAEARMRDAGHGEPPCRYAVAVLGSAGRGESLLAMDQDNALVFADGEPGSAQDSWFEDAWRPYRRHSARGRRAVLPRRRDGEERAMARFARHLERARRRLDTQRDAAGAAVGRYLFRHAPGARRRHALHEPLAPRLRHGAGRVRLRQAVG